MKCVDIISFFGRGKLASSFCLLLPTYPVQPTADGRDVTKHQTSTFQIDCDTSDKTTTIVKNKDQKVIVTLLKYHQEAREPKSPDLQTTQAWQCTMKVGELSES